MLKKITTIISTNKNSLVRKAAVIGGVVAGIAIGVLMNKVEDPDMVVVQELIDEEETTTDGETSDQDTGATE
jgi:hypothetical protein